MKDKYKSMILQTIMIIFLFIGSAVCVNALYLSSAEYGIIGGVLAGIGFTLAIDSFIGTLEAK